MSSEETCESDDSFANSNEADEMVSRYENRKQRRLEIQIEEERAVAS